MKRIYYILFLLLPPDFTYAQTAYRLLASSTYAYNGTWQPTDSMRYAYNTTSRGQNRGGGWLYDNAMSFHYNGQWDSVQRFTQTFDAHNNVVIRKDEKPVYGWIAGDFRDSFGYYYSAAARYVVCTQLRKKWNTVFNNWEPFELYSCYIDTSKLPQNMLKQTWNKATLMWDNAELETYTYDTHFNITAKVFYTFNTAKQQWDPVQRTGISYFSPTLYSRVVISKSKNNVWVDSVSTTYNYNAKNEPITETVTQWNLTSAVWNNGKKYDRTFDANHNVLTEITQQWNNAGWSNMQRVSMAYDANNNLTATVNEVWNASSGAWVYDASSVHKRYYYEVYYPVAVPTIQTAQPTFTIYPNPCTGAFTVSVDKHDFKNGMVVISDAVGKVVYSQSQIPDLRFSIILNQPKGIYFVTLRLDDSVYMNQLMVE